MEEIIKLLIEKITKNSILIFKNYENDYNNINKKYESNIHEEIDFTISFNYKIVFSTSIILVTFGIILFILINKNSITDYIEFGIPLDIEQIEFTILFVIYFVFCITYPVILILKPKIKVKNDYLIYKEEKYYYFDISKIVKSSIGLVVVYSNYKRLLYLSMEYKNYGSFIAWAEKHNISIIDNTKDYNSNSKEIDPKILMLIIILLIVIIFYVTVFVTKAILL